MRSAAAAVILVFLSIGSGVAASENRFDWGAGIDSQLRVLGAITMREEVTRYVINDGRMRRLDQFRGLVDLFHGVETFATLNAKEAADRRMPGKSGTPSYGAVSYGDFSALLRISRDALASGASQIVEGHGESKDSGTAAVRVAFALPASSATWYVAVNSRVYWLDFRGEIAISADTGEALSISWVSEAPAGVSDIRQLRRTITFVPAQVGDRIHMLPEHSEYRIIHAGRKEEWNDIRFSDPVRYGSTVSLAYGAEVR